MEDPRVAQGKDLHGGWESCFQMLPWTPRLEPHPPVISVYIIRFCLKLENGIYVPSITCIITLVKKIQSYFFIHDLVNDWKEISKCMFAETEGGP